MPYFDNPWHYHPEIELTLITKSKGTRFVGDHVERFKEGDLVLLGSNLPHYWRNDALYYRPNSTEMAEAMILRFSLDFLGKPLLLIPEMHGVKQLIEEASHGISYGQITSDRVKPFLQKMHLAKGIDPLINFLQIFKILSQAKDGRALSKKFFGESNPINDSDRMNQVLNYIHFHLQENITLEMVANLSNMNATAFCRYIKAKTNKTFIELLNDIRIAYACRLLLDGPRNISEICYNCGFNNLTHFNYIFKKITGTNPSNYRKSKGEIMNKVFV
ncbi:MAG: AraC family transcriptional regulator [Cytophagales bacterium]|nr:AraC family transcriptional regulator [Cytophagales bacterium]